MRPHNLDITNDGKLIAFSCKCASNDVSVTNTTTLNVIKKIPISIEIMALIFHK
jgi:hypothetical protein